jgi:hypothetical protein
MLQPDFKSIFCRFSLSAVAYLSASANISATSVSFKLDAPELLLIALHLFLSRAFTDKIPSTSISNVTSICGTPRSAFGIPSSLKFPKLLFPATNSLSPVKCEFQHLSDYQLLLRTFQIF